MLAVAARIAFLVTAARVSFAAALLPWFWIGAVSKLAGHTLSVGPAAGAWPLSLGAFYAFLPQIMDSGAEPGVVAVSYVWVTTLAALVLPPMVAAGLLARWSAAFLIGQMVLGSGLATRPGQASALFDASPYDAVPDQLLLWAVLILPVVLFGAMPLSLDAGLLTQVWPEFAAADRACSPQNGASAAPDRSVRGPGPAGAVTQT